MQSRLLPLAILFATAFGAVPTLRADSLHVSLRVEQSNKAEVDKTDRLKKTQTRALSIFITNATKDPLDLKVKYVTFGRDLGNHDVVTVAQGEKPTTVPPSGTSQVDTDPAVSISEEEHFDVKLKKKVEGTGSKIIGYGVQILQGTTVVGENYDPPSMQEFWGKTLQPTPAAGAVPKPAATPAKAAATPAPAKQ